VRAYERLTRVPDGFLVIGDAVCGFNPIYGQGMTVAALQALALRDHLHQHAAPQPRRFLREIARVIDAPWEMATGADLALPGIEGHRTLRGRVAGAYIARLHAAAAHDAGLACAFVRVSGLVDRLDRRTHQGQISAASSTRWPSGSRT
jgi:flavin-dependent dehydrogenase